MIEMDRKTNQSFSFGLKQEGYLVDNTHSMKKGIWMAKTNYYDLIILLAEKEVLKLEEILKDLSLECPLSFILISTRNQTTENKIKLFELGADDIVDSNFSFKEFLLKIKILLRREKLPTFSLPVLQVDDLIINRKNFQVSRGGEKIYLRRKEFDLLCYFYQNRDQILSRPNLLENVWDSNADFFTNTLEVHILNLRKKIDSRYPKSRRLIQTIHGRGYRFGLAPSLSGEI